jgi:hypothetical protein
MKLAASFMVLILLFISNMRAQNLNVAVYNANGTNLLDVEKSEDYELEDWNTYSNETLVEFTRINDNGFILGGEFGIHRLYYWERREPYYGYYIWGTLWTYHVGGLIGFAPTEKLSFKTGFNFRYYGDGSGVAFAIVPLAADYKIIKISRHFSIPVGIRTDAIFANAFTFSINLSIGLRYQIK